MANNIKSGAKAFGIFHASRFLFLLSCEYSDLLSVDAARPARRRRAKMLLSINVVMANLYIHSAIFQADGRAAVCSTVFNFYLLP